MVDQTSNEISHVQSENKARFHENKNKQIKLTPSPLELATKVKLTDKANEIGVDNLKKQIRLFFNTPLDVLKKLK